MSNVTKNQQNEYQETEIKTKKVKKPEEMLQYLTIAELNCNRISLMFN